MHEIFKKMRKIAFALLIALSVTAVAQEKQLISTAVIALDNRNDLPEAKKYIDQAGDAIKAKGGSTDVKQMSKYLYYRGVIYMRLALNDSPDLAALAPDGIDVAAASFIELLEFEAKQGDKARYSQDAAGYIPTLSNALKSKAYDQNEANDYLGAAEYFKKAYELQSNPALGEMAVTDTITYYYTGLSYNAASKYPESIAIFEDILKMGYNGYTYLATSVASDQPMRFGSKKDMDDQVKLGIAVNPTIGPSERPNVYKTLLGAFLATENTEDFSAYLAQARSEFPNDVSLINLELQGYIDAKEYKKALDILDLAIAKNPENAIYYYVKGFIYQTNMKDNDAALAAYAKAIEVADTSFDAWFMSGVVWYDQGKEVIEQMNKLTTSKADQKKYDELTVVKKGKFEKSVPFFEKAHELNPTDAETIKALWEVYRQLRMNEKAMEMKKKLDALPAATTNSEIKAE